MYQYITKQGVSKAGLKLHPDIVRQLKEIYATRSARDSSYAGRSKVLSPHFELCGLRPHIAWRMCAQAGSGAVQGKRARPSPACFAIVDHAAGTIEYRDEDGAPCAPPAVHTKSTRTGPTGPAGASPTACPKPDDDGGVPEQSRAVRAKLTEHSADERAPSAFTAAAAPAPATTCALADVHAPDAAHALPPPPPPQQPSPLPEPEPLPLADGVQTETDDLAEEDDAAEPRVPLGGPG